ncbi:MAG: hypothetical protein ACR2Q3_15100 [Woeseiaceae bacterium]
MHDCGKLITLSCTAMLLFGCSQQDNAVPQATSGSISDHVTFYGVGKVARYQQHMDSSLQYLGPLFFSEIFIAAGGEVSDASVKFPPPANERKALQYRYSESDEIGDVMYLSGSAASDEELERNFPSAAFEFTFSTPGGDVTDSVVSFEGGAFPTQPIIIFEQQDSRIPFEQVDAKQDLVITWPPFTEGRADINGILDDLIFVAIDSCTVEDIVHSGRPFEKDNYLTFRATDYVVPAGTLEPGQTYSMYVEHALLPNTQQDYGMPAFATFAASTYMDFKTVGQTDPAFCEESVN